ncbi:hypothetical protein M407DRAFT_24415 [Tulasnella calospora MUT 4182]|uniref:Uncharacterized protein n=1 Tax=Tulasnella calospora MUT 4182 TaxID=1051891 RepID=A0A0C3KY96_9AGAM|nr:hypothetical protein M407DRAFT_24415 [Tulasnella calospora MUT 4182]
MSNPFAACVDDDLPRENRVNVALKEGMADKHSGLSTLDPHLSPLGNYWDELNNDILEEDGDLDNPPPIR